MAHSDAADHARLGFIGLGAMGGPMARNLVRAGYSVTGFDVDADRLQSATTAGVCPAANTPELVAASDVVLTSLRSSAVFVEVAEGELIPHAREGQALIDLGTTAPPEAQRLAGEFAARGASLLEAPVSGGPGGAQSGTLRMFVGGERETYERCRPVLEVLGDPERVVYCGPSGCGQIVKGVNQLAMGLGAAAYLEAVAFGALSGVDPEAMEQAVGGGPEPWRQYFASLARAVAEGSAERVWVKFPELPYFLDEAREQGLRLPLTEALFAFLDVAPKSYRDNMGRPTASFWHELRRSAPDSKGQ